MERTRWLIEYAVNGETIKRMVYALDEKEILDILFENYGNEAELISKNVVYEVRL